MAFLSKLLVPRASLSLGSPLSRSFVPTGLLAALIAGLQQLGLAHRKELRGHISCHVPLWLLQHPCSECLLEAPM